jgi:hypothetical protein
MMTEVIAAANYCINLFVSIRNNYLERAKKLSTAKLEILNKFFKRDLDGSGLVASVY